MATSWEEWEEYLKSHPRESAPGTRGEWEAYLGRPLEGYEITRTSRGAYPWGGGGGGGGRRRGMNLPQSWAEWEKTLEPAVATLMRYYFQTSKERREEYAKQHAEIGKVLEQNKGMEDYLEQLYAQRWAELLESAAPWYVGWVW